MKISSPIQKIFFGLFLAFLLSILVDCKREPFKVLPLSVLTQDTTGITLHSFTLNGMVEGFGGEDRVMACFRWGASADKLSQITPWIILEDSRNFSHSLENLQPNESIFFQAVVKNNVNVEHGDVIQARTAAFDTDYYRVVINDDGTLTFADLALGEPLLAHAPKYFFNYGSTTDERAGPQNASFERDSANNGIPDRWKVNKKYIRITEDKASLGKQSLLFKRSLPEKEAKTADSSRIEIEKGSFYSISFDYFIENFASVGWSSLRIYIYYFDGASWTRTSSFTDLSNLYSFIPINMAGEWKQKSFFWIPPAEARSFYIQFYMDSDVEGSVYLDNVKIFKKKYDYISNASPLSSQVIEQEKDIFIKAVDDQNPHVKLIHEYRLNSHSPHVSYTAEIHYKQDLDVTEERFDFVLPDQKARVMTRDFIYEDFKPSKIYSSDLYSPRIVKFEKGIYFLGSDTVESMQLKVSESGIKLSCYADHFLNHPHFYFPLEAEVARSDTSIRYAGTIRIVSVNFAIHQEADLKAVIKTRQPFGYDASLTLTSHPDDWTYERTKAVAYGCADEQNSDFGRKGIIGKGLGWTFGLFADGGKNGFGLNVPENRSLVDQMYRDGVEIAAHTIAPGTESREEILSGLETFSKYGVRNWIDHSASTGKSNLESMKSRGGLKGNEYYILDLLDRFDFQYAWSYIDLPTEHRSLNILEPKKTSLVRPYLFYNNRLDDVVDDEKKIYLWSTINTEKQPERFYTKNRVDDLIRERGVHISHEYYGFPSCENHAFLEENGQTKIFPKFDSQLEYIAEKRSEGSIWSPTISSMGEFLIALKDIFISYKPDGIISITNKSSNGLTGVTILCEKPVRSVQMDSFLLVSFAGSYGKREIVLPTLLPDRSVNLKIEYGKRDPSIPSLRSDDAGKKKLNELTGYWDKDQQTLIMTAEPRIGEGSYSFTVRIPALAGEEVTIEDLTTNSIVGRFKTSKNGNVTFKSPLRYALHRFKITKS